MKESQQLNMIVKRRAPIPLIEFEQRTLKFTLSKSRKKEGKQYLDLPEFSKLKRSENF
uniref:Uncharacterized protein n=1 Tax=Parascaris equorum TaxID=6256 RepID=A0A914RDU8_PAREQ